MASTKRRTVNSGEGLEVDPRAAGLHELPESLGIEATPGEFRPTPAPQTVEVSELGHDRAKTAQLRPPSSSDLEISSGSRSPRKSKHILPLLVATIIIVVIVLALAIPLALRLKKPSKPYVRDLDSRQHV